MKKLEHARIYYHKSPALTNTVIKRFLRDNEEAVLHGGKAVNAFLPSHLDKHTEDWDIIVPDNPRAVAEQLEGLLDARYEGNFFKVLPSRHIGTYRIISLVTQRPIADITIAEGPIPTKVLDGINVATLDYHVQGLKEAIANPKKKFRWRKDQETLQRINIHKEEEKAKVPVFPPYEF